MVTMNYEKITLDSVNLWIGFKNLLGVRITLVDGRFLWLIQILAVDFQWRHIILSENLSRGIRNSKALTVWFHGPQFLKNSPLTLTDVNTESRSYIYQIREKI